MSAKPFQTFKPPKIVVLDEQNERISSSNGSVSSRQSSKDSMEPPAEFGNNSAPLKNSDSIGRANGQCIGSNKSKLIKSRASELIIRIPSRHLKRIMRTQGIKSLQRETQHFVVYRSRGAFRFFWITVTTVSLVLLLWQITKLVQLYFSRPTASQISFLLNDNGLPFPAVTICSHQPISQQFVENSIKAMNISQRLLEYIMLSFVDVQHLLSVSDQDELAFADEEWKEFTHLLAPKFTLCSFGGREFDCCEYAKGILTDIGKCYQLDLSSTDQPWLRGQVQAGINNGLQIIVDARTEQQTNSLFLDTAHPFADSLDTGFRYYVHEQFSLPYLSTEGISVSPGTKAYSAISPTHYILLPQQMWGNCSDRWPEDLQQIVNDGAADDRYSSVKCKTLCRSKYFNDLCGCSPFSYNVDEFYSVCTPYEIYKCLNSTVLNDTKWFQNGMAKPGLEDFHQIIPVCPQCKIECQRWVYHTYNSYAQAFPHKTFGRLRRKASKWSSIVSLNIFYRDMAYTEYKQVQSLSMTEILSDIGGNMGLFLGMSLISLIEFVTYICKISWLFISKKRRDHMLAKKRHDEEREQQLQQTLEMTNSRANDLPTSQFDTIIRRISRSIQRKPARAEKSAVFILPVSGQRQNSESDDIPSSTKLSRPANSLKSCPTLHENAIWLIQSLKVACTEMPAGHQDEAVLHHQKHYLQQNEKRWSLKLTWSQKR
uniref:Amiloride-sensitive sodium channel n=1 Tax=Globodera rostochiensis TaxID=31243 RepID=A0A914H0Q6_GLORO